MAHIFKSLGFFLLCVGAIAKLHRDPHIASSSLPGVDNRREAIPLVELEDDRAEPGVIVLSALGHGEGHAAAAGGGSSQEIPTLNHCDFAPLEI